MSALSDFLTQDAAPWWGSGVIGVASALLGISINARINKNRDAVEATRRKEESERRDEREDKLRDADLSREDQLRLNQEIRVMAAKFLTDATGIVYTTQTARVKHLSNAASGIVAQLREAKSDPDATKLLADLKNVFASNSVNPAAEVLQELGDLPDRVKALGFAFNELEMVLPDDLIAEAKVIMDSAIKLSLQSAPQEFVKPESKVFDDACAQFKQSVRRYLVPPPPYARASSHPKRLPPPGEPSGRV